MPSAPRTVATYISLAPLRLVLVLLLPYCIQVIFILTGLCSPKPARVNCVRFAFQMFMFLRKLSGTCAGSGLGLKWRRSPLFAGHLPASLPAFSRAGQTTGVVEDPHLNFSYNLANFKSLTEGKDVTASVSFLNLFNRKYVGAISGFEDSQSLFFLVAPPRAISFKDGTFWTSIRSLQGREKVDFSLP